jgi:diadenosine tetraphosphate (Ap4A) HIT family hydrolase
MNYECLGNSSPHLHWHLIPRYIDDPRWGQPVWEGWPRHEFTLHRVTLEDHAYADLVALIRSHL